ncbi:MAG: hypothetical protein NZ108_11225, partial [Bacteroidia bacterium]|nr:hypothetical protein [Bacteroidia bacterium]
TNSGFGTTWTANIHSAVDTLTGLAWNGHAATIVLPNGDIEIHSTSGLNDVGKVIRMNLIVRNLQTGCQAIITRFMRVRPTPTIVASPDVIFCEGSSATISAISSTGNYLWNTGQTTSSITVFDDGTYSVLTKDSIGCEAYDTVQVTKSTIEFSLLPDTIRSCGIATLNASIANGISYHWNHGFTSPIITVQSPGIYTVTATNNHNCSKSKSVLVELEQQISLENKTIVNGCLGEGVRVNYGFYPGNYLWSNGATAPEIVINQAGNYHVAIQRGSCEFRDSFTVVLNNSPSFTLGPDRIGCGAVLLTPQPLLTSHRYYWSMGDTTPQFLVTFSGT